MDFCVRRKTKNMGYKCVLDEIKPKEKLTGKQHQSDRHPLGQIKHASDLKFRRKETN